MLKGGDTMENDMRATEAMSPAFVGTYDFASPVELVRVIDLAMRHYFEVNDWLSLRDRLFPGLRRQP